MKAIARLITGRRSKYLVVLLVLVVAGGLASQAGKVVLTSDPAVLLPDGAESVRALRAIERFPSGDVTPAVIVVERDGGLTAADRESLAGIDTDLPGAGRTAGPQVSEDGTAAVLVVPFSDVGEDELVEGVDTLRERASELEARAYVTGGAGFSADVTTWW